MIPGVVPHRLQIAFPSIRHHDDGFRPGGQTADESTNRCGIPRGGAGLGHDLPLKAPTMTNSWTLWSGACSCSTILDRQGICAILALEWNNGQSKRPNARLVEEFGGEGRCSGKTPFPAKVRMAAGSQNAIASIPIPGLPDTSSTALSAISHPCPNCSPQCNTAPSCRAGRAGRARWKSRR